MDSEPLSQKRRESWAGSGRAAGNDVEARLALVRLAFLVDHSEVVVVRGSFGEGLRVCQSDWVAALVVACRRSVATAPSTVSSLAAGSALAAAEAYLVAGPGSSAVVQGYLSRGH